MIHTFFEQQKKNKTLKFIQNTKIQYITGENDK